MSLIIENLTAGYGSFTVLRNLSISVQAGNFVALIGPNGAGKSTVLKAIMNLTERQQGSISFYDQRIEKLPTHSIVELGISFVPQGRTSFPSMTVEENILLGGYLLDHRETRKANLASVYERFPALKHKRLEKAGALSGGQQQQLAIGRALMTSPKLLMLDEPTLGLSPKLMHEVMDTLVQLKNEGIALLVVEQNVRLVLEYADRGYLLANGEVREEGSAKHLSSDALMHSAFLS